jgi:hypothetical protein
VGRPPPMDESTCYIAIDPDLGEKEDAAILAYVQSKPNHGIIMKRHNQPHVRDLSFRF